MADCKIRSFNAVRARMFGYKLTPTQWLILQRSWHTHNEFQYSARHDHVSHSATLMDGAKGSRFKAIAYTHPERWDTVIVPMTNAEEDRAYDRAQQLEGTLYDLRGQLCHVSGLKIWKPNPAKIWCTKDVAEQVYSGRPDFHNMFIYRKIDMNELKPNQLDMLARYYFSK